MRIGNNDFQWKIVTKCANIYLKAVSEFVTFEWGHTYERIRKGNFKDNRRASWY